MTLPKKGIIFLIGFAETVTLEPSASGSILDTPKVWILNVTEKHCRLRKLKFFNLFLQMLFWSLTDFLIPHHNITYVFFFFFNKMRIFKRNNLC